MDDTIPPYSILYKIIFHDIDIYVSVCEKGNPFRRLVCVDCRRHDLQFTVFTVHQTPALMDDRSSGTGEFSVDFKNGFMRTETERCLVCIILSKTQREFPVHIF